MQTFVQINLDVDLKMYQQNTIAHLIYEQLNKSFEFNRFIMKVEDFVDKRLPTPFHYFLEGNQKMTLFLSTVGSLLTLNLLPTGIEYAVNILEKNVPEFISDWVFSNLFRLNNDSYIMSENYVLMSSFLKGKKLSPSLIDELQKFHFKYKNSNNYSSKFIKFLNERDFDTSKLEKPNRRLFSKDKLYKLWKENFLYSYLNIVTTDITKDILSGQLSVNDIPLLKSVLGDFYYTLNLDQHSFLVNLYNKTDNYSKQLIYNFVWGAIDLKRVDKLLSTNVLYYLPCIIQHTISNNTNIAKLLPEILSDIQVFNIIYPKHHGFDQMTTDFELDMKRDLEILKSIVPDKDFPFDEYELVKDVIDRSKYGKTGIQPDEEINLVKGLHTLQQYLTKNRNVVSRLKNTLEKYNQKFVKNGVGLRIYDFKPSAITAELLEYIVNNFQQGNTNIKHLQTLQFKSSVTDKDLQEIIAKTTNYVKLLEKEMKNIENPNDFLKFKESLNRDIYLTNDVKSKLLDKTESFLKNNLLKDENLWNLSHMEIDRWIRVLPFDKLNKHLSDFLENREQLFAELVNRDFKGTRIEVLQGFQITSNEITQYANAKGYKEAVSKLNGRRLSNEKSLIDSLENPDEITSFTELVQQFIEVNSYLPYITEETHVEILKEHIGKLRARANILLSDNTFIKIDRMSAMKSLDIILFTINKDNFPHELLEDKQSTYDRLKQLSTTLMTEEVTRLRKQQITMDMRRIYDTIRNAVDEYSSYGVLIESLNELELFSGEKKYERIKQSGLKKIIDILNIELESDDMAKVEKAYKQLVDLDIPFEKLQKLRERILNDFIIIKTNAIVESQEDSLEADISKYVDIVTQLHGFRQITTNDNKYLNGQIEKHIDEIKTILETKHDLDVMNEEELRRLLPEFKTIEQEIMKVRLYFDQFYITTYVKELRKNIEKVEEKIAQIETNKQLLSEIQNELKGTLEFSRLTQIGIILQESKYHQLDNYKTIHDLFVEKKKTYWENELSKIPTDSIDGINGFQVIKVQLESLQRLIDKDYQDTKYIWTRIEQSIKNVDKKIKEEAEREKLQRQVKAKKEALTQVRVVNAFIKNKEEKQAERQRLQREAEEAERQRLQREAEEAERQRLQREAEEAERQRLQREAEEAERQRLEREAEEAERQRLQREAEEAERQRLEREAEEAERQRLQREAEEAERQRLEREAEEAERQRLQREAEEAERQRLEREAQLERKGFDAFARNKQIKQNERLQREAEEAERQRLQRREKYMKQLRGIAFVRKVFIDGVKKRRVEKERRKQEQDKKNKEDQDETEDQDILDGEIIRGNGDYIPGEDEDEEVSEGEDEIPTIKKFEIIKDLISLSPGLMRHLFGEKYSELLRVLVRVKENPESFTETINSTFTGKHKEIIEFLVNKINIDHLKRYAIMNTYAEFWSKLSPYQYFKYGLLKGQNYETYDEFLRHNPNFDVRNVRINDLDLDAVTRFKQAYDITMYKPSNEFHSYMYNEFANTYRYRSEDYKNYKELQIAPIENDIIDMGFPLEFSLLKIIKNLEKRTQQMRDTFIRTFMIPIPGDPFFVYDKIAINGIVKLIEQFDSRGIKEKKSDNPKIHINLTLFKLVDSQIPNIDDNYVLPKNINNMFTEFMKSNIFNNYFTFPEEENKFSLYGDAGSQKAIGKPIQNEYDNDNQRVITGFLKVLLTAKLLQPTSGSHPLFQEFLNDITIGNKNVGYYKDHFGIEPNYENSYSKQLLDFIGVNQSELNKMPKLLFSIFYKILKTFNTIASKTPIKFS
jgi:hypothetical protein